MTARPVTAPSVTVAVTVAAVLPSLVGVCICTTGGLVVEYPAPPVSSETDLTPLINGFTEASLPTSDLIVTLGGYSNL